LGRFLDPRESVEARREPIAGAVNIPFSELGERLHELPSRDGPVEIVASGELFERTAALLRASGRQARRALDFGPGESACRLWEPNPLLERVLDEIRVGRALDIGCGTGREVCAMAAAGFDVLAVDRLPEALERGRNLATRYLGPEEATRIEWRELTIRSSEDLPEGPFELIVAFRWFDLGVLQAAKKLLSPGGSLVMEAFTREHRARHGKPRTEAFLASENDLDLLSEGMEARIREYGWIGPRHSARLWAVRP
jgi:SAM-dependent methyltransferase